jgi:hypothetical protein
MGVVYEAWQESMERQVALKVLPGGLLADLKAVARFEREAKLAGSLQHPNIVSVHGMGVDDNTPHYAMDYVAGETLARLLGQWQKINDGAPTAFGEKNEQVFFWSMAGAFAAVADGLQHAHSKGVIHRDIKPSNLILDQEHHLRILDFGLARLEGQESLTLSGELVGTPRYMSPEQARRQRISVDHRTDIYSLGATLYEVLTGQPPFLGKDHTETLSQIVTRDPVEPRRVNPRVPRDLETIVLKCLRKEPSDRYGSAEAVAQDLRRFVRGDPVEARPQTTWEKARRRAWNRRHLILFASVISVLLVALIVLLARNARDQHRLERFGYVHGVTEAVQTMQLGGRLTTRIGLESPLVPDPYNVLLPHSRAQVTPDAAVDPVGQSLAILNRLIEAMPGEPDARYHRARALLLVGRDDEAREELERARTLWFVPASLLEANLLVSRDQEVAADRLVGATKRSRSTRGRTRL